jgi:hypothetical protein
MKNSTLTTLLITLTIGTAIQARPLLRSLATTSATLAGAVTGYHVTNDTIDSVKAKNYSYTAEMVTYSALGGALATHTGTQLAHLASTIDACMKDHKAEPFVYKTAQVSRTFARSMGLGSRAMLAASLATAGYQYTYPALKNVRVTLVPITKQPTLEEI